MIMNKKDLVERAIVLAEQFIGTPYIWWGKDENWFDCSGLWWRVFSQMGIRFSSRFTATMLYETTAPLAQDQVERGDFIFRHETPKKKRHRPIYHIEMVVDKPFLRFWKRYVKTIGSSSARKFSDKKGTIYRQHGLGFRTREITQWIYFAKAYYDQLMDYDTTQNPQTLEVNYGIQK